MPRSTRPLNYTPVPPKDPVAEIIAATEDAKLLRKAKALIRGRKEVEGLPDVTDVAGGLTPEEWLSGTKGFLTKLVEAQSAKPRSQTLGKDLARGAVANTLGLLVPPLRERAIAGMSPVGQVATEVLNPTNWPLGGAEAGVPLSFFATRLRPNAIGLGEGVIKDVERGIMRGANKDIRLHPIDPNTGEFRPLHAGTEFSALERLVAAAHPVNETRTPTLTRADLPVRDTLGTFDAPLDDPGGDWINNDRTRMALQKEGIDAVIYRNAVEGKGEISLEALREFVNPETRAVPVRSPNQALGDILAASHQSANAPHQLTLPLEHFKQSSNEWLNENSVTMRPEKAAERLNLKHPREGPNSPKGFGSRYGDWSWDDVWSALHNKHNPPNPK